MEQIPYQNVTGRDMGFVCIFSAFDERCLKPEHYAINIYSWMNWCAFCFVLFPTRKILASPDTLAQDLIIDRDSPDSRPASKVVWTPPPRNLDVPYPLL